MKQPYLTYALDAFGKLVHVDSVPNGKACECFCTFCGEPLQAKQGAKRRHHFSHISGTECEAAYESMLHLLAKEKIQEAFYNKKSFWIKFEYTSYCNVENCIFVRQGNRCCEKSIRSFDLKKWYDTCEQEIVYDNIRRRSDLKFSSKVHSERKPIYLEFCVTHASDEAKLHSGNKIIEIVIENEEDILLMANDGIAERHKTIGPEWDESIINLVAFYGFKKEDYLNQSINKEEWIVRCAFMESGKMYSLEERCNCKQIGRKDHRALCEVVFPEFYKYEAYDCAYSICQQKYHICNCNLCKNYVTVTPWFDNSYTMCKMYKVLQLPFSDFKIPGAFDTSRAKSCRFYYRFTQKIDNDIKYIIV
jgi:hypothetical protein